MEISHKERLIKDMLSVCSLSSDELSDASRMEFIDKAISWHYLTVSNAEEPPK